MNPNHPYIQLVRRDSISDAETMIDDLPDTRPEQSSSAVYKAFEILRPHHKVSKGPQRRVLVLRTFLIVVVLILAVIGSFLAAWTVHLTNGLRRIPGDRFDELFGPEVFAGSSLIWDTQRESLIREAFPVPVHSHNDYWRRIPLFEALGSGCTSIEADVYLRDADLLVGHTTSELRPHANLRTMYLDPLERILKARNTNMNTKDWHGIFDLATRDTVVLLVDHKTEGTETLAMLSAQLQPLRDLDFLTYWNGTARVVRPLTVVATGNAPFFNSAGYRDIFWDADLNCLVSEHDTVDYYLYNSSNSYYASAQWSDALSRELTTQSPPNIALQIERAKARGLVARYWDTPVQPPNLRDFVWRKLVEHGVGILNMDDMGVVRDRAKGWGNLRP